MPAKAPPPMPDMSKLKGCKGSVLIAITSLMWLAAIIITAIKM